MPQLCFSVNMLYRLSVLWNFLIRFFIRPKHVGSLYSLLTWYSFTHKSWQGWTFCSDALLLGRSLVNQNYRCYSLFLSLVWCAMCANLLVPSICSRNVHLIFVAIKPYKYILLIYTSNVHVCMTCTICRLIFVTHIHVCICTVCTLHHHFTLPAFHFFLAAP